MIYRIKQLTLVVGDLLVFYVSLYISLCLRYLEFPPKQWPELFSPMTQLFIAAVVIFFVVGLYDVGRSKNNFRFFKKILIAAVIWFFIGLIYFYLNQSVGAKPKTIMLLTAMVGAGLISLWRYLHNRFLSKSILNTRIAFAGITPETVEIIAKLEREPELGYEIIGMVKGEDKQVQESLPGLEKYPTAANLTDLYARSGKTAELIVIAPLMAKNDTISKELYSQLFRQTGVIDLVKFYEEILKRIPPFTFSESWFLSNLQEQDKKVYDRFKILVDYVSAALMAVVFAATFPIIAIIIRLTSPGPIFFVQERLGRNASVFKIFKYRTMKALTKDGSAELDGPRFASSDDERITPFGKFMRKTRLDELPQFINIFKNEMSLIGPRPERPEFVSQLTAQMPFYSLRHLIKPGLTGWAQIQKSYYGTIEENLHKLEYDLYYLKNRNLFLDIAIVLRTFNILGKMAGR